MTSSLPGASAPLPASRRAGSASGDAQSLSGLDAGAPVGTLIDAIDDAVNDSRDDGRPTAQSPSSRVRGRSTPSSLTADLKELAKPRITVMVAVTAAAGYVLGAPSGVDPWALLALVLGTSALSAGASALNQVVERDTDAMMARTRARPLAAGRMEPLAGVAAGVAASLAGVLLLVAGTNLLTAAVGVITLLLYVAVYTPLKRVTSLCTIVGAVPGALPPLMGWTAATGTASIEGWVLFAILFLWQMPHFLAIAWLYREDYARGGQPMLPVIDAQGTATGRQIVVYCLALLPATVLPWILHLSGAIYLSGALLLGLVYLAAGVRTAQDLTSASARTLLRVSVAYLPGLLALMTLDRPGS